MPYPQYSKLDFSDPQAWVRYVYPTGTPSFPLWISTQLHLSHPIRLDPWALCGQSTPEGAKPLTYELYANLWWLPPGADAGAHAAHGHNFLEVHTQLIGSGRMQKFEDLSVAQRLLAERSGRLPTGGGTYPFDDGGAFPGLYEEYRLAPGASHPPMPIVTPYNAWGDQTDIARNASINDPCFYYPPHQYYADTESVWITFEYHRRL